MVTKTAARPPLRGPHSHSHSHSQSQSRALSHSRSHSHQVSKASKVTATTPSATSNPTSIPSLAIPTSVSSLRTPAMQMEPRSQSPNYFGLVVEPATDPQYSEAGPKGHWSPPTSSIRSFAATSPQHVPVESNPDFEAFKRQTESKGFFNLGHGNLSHFSTTPGVGYGVPNLGPSMSLSSPRSRAKEDTAFPMIVEDAMDIDSTKHENLGSSQADVRTLSPSLLNEPRQESPASFKSSHRPSSPPSIPRNVLSRLEDKHPRLSLPSHTTDALSPSAEEKGMMLKRAETLPSALEEGPLMLTASQLKPIIEEHQSSQYLLLDLRVYPQYSTSRIQDALNLCIPTTLLKRPSFDLKKLADTFTNTDEKAKFLTWKSCQTIIVYDAFSSEKRDAVSAVNTLKKFTNEGWLGNSYILKGGFRDFSKHFPMLVDQRSSLEVQSSKQSLTLDSSMPNVAPVAGGCAMPAVKNAANPFFSNIRQNMDLVGGVGQLDVKRPPISEERLDSQLPPWLRDATATADHGKIVADKFLRIEQTEQSRMQQALSSGNSYNAASNEQPVRAGVQIAGIEKGSKNRYNNIWPFEHARVKLQGRSDGACDYVNASHVKASLSNKRYIASQGPLPATFEDFWSVIWDHDVRVIVMLTAESEGGQLKCHPYWAAREYGSLRLKALSEKRISLEQNKHRIGRASTNKSDSGRRRSNTGSGVTNQSSSPPNIETPHVIVRKFALTHGSHPFLPMREITQLHYTFWPDFGAPAQPSQLLGLIELSNAVQRANSSASEVTKADEAESSSNARPFLVHCSAGCGRTGTFCTVDSVIDMLKRQHKEQDRGIVPMELSTPVKQYKSTSAHGEIETGSDWISDDSLDLIQKAVEDFRYQRISMVQSLRQYVLCYETVLEWMAQQRLPQEMGSRNRSGSESRLERNFGDSPQ